MARAVWNGTVLAESSETILVEGNLYFPHDSIRIDHFRPNPAHTVCPWKGTASYYDIEVDGAVNAGAAWYYPDPKPAATDIKGHVAFWRGISVQI